MRLFSTACTVLALVVLVGCGGADSENGTDDSSETMTHSGTVTDLDAEAKKVTVDVDDNGTMEFTVGESTPILKRYSEVPFDSLETGQLVGVEVDKESSAPQKVNIAQ